MRSFPQIVNGEDVTSQDLLDCLQEKLIWTPINADFGDRAQFRGKILALFYFCLVFAESYLNFNWVSVEFHLSSTSLAPQYFFCPQIGSKSTPFHTKTQNYQLFWPWSSQMNQSQKAVKIKRARTCNLKMTNCGPIFGPK